MPFTEKDLMGTATSEAKHEGEQPSEIPAGEADSELWSVPSELTGTIEETDPELLLLAGAEREAMATPLFQAFARSVRRGVMVAGIDSEEAELAAAASYYRRALAADPGKVEARVRLGRVLGLRGRYAEAVEELRRAMAAPIDPTYQYFVLLFLGDGLEGMGDQTEALDAFEQAATLVPWARRRTSRSRGCRASVAIARER